VDALREVLVRRPDADLLDAGVGGGETGGRGEPVVGLELDHGPDGDAHRRERVLERAELREERAIHALGRLVPGPQIVTEGLDDVVGGHAEVRRAALEHLRGRMKDARYRAEWRVHALGRPPRAVEVAEELVRAVDEVDDHAAAEPSR